MIKSVVRKVFLPRVIFVVSIALAGMALYEDAYIENIPPVGGSYAFLFFIVIIGNFVGVWLIENYDEKWQMFSGYLCLYTFFVVAFGGAFFNW